MLCMPCTAGHGSSPQHLGGWRASSSMPACTHQQAGVCRLPSSLPPLMSFLARAGGMTCSARASSAARVACKQGIENNTPALSSTTGNQGSIAGNQGSVTGNQGSIVCQAARWNSGNSPPSSCAAVVLPIPAPMGAPRPARSLFDPSTKPQAATNPSRHSRAPPASQPGQPAPHLSGQVDAGVVRAAVHRHRQVVNRQLGHHRLAALRCTQSKGSVNTSMVL